MLSTAEKMAAKLAEAISHPKIPQTTIAEACGVTKQAVQGWLKNGRIDKGHFAALARVTGRPLEWWFDAETGRSSPTKLRSFVAKQSLEKLATLGAKLDEGDWQLLLTTAEHLAGGAGDKPRNRKQPASR